MHRSRGLVHGGLRSARCLLVSQALEALESTTGRTCDVFIQDVFLLGNVLDEFPADLVHNKDFPLEAARQRYVPKNI